MISTIIETHYHSKCPTHAFHTRISCLSAISFNSFTFTFAHSQPLVLTSMLAAVGKCRWVDERRMLRVMANADSPEDAVSACKQGAEGIGLCRTEHMFFSRCGYAMHTALCLLLVCTHMPAFV